MLEPSFQSTGGKVRALPVCCRPATIRRDACGSSSFLQFFLSSRRDAIVTKLSPENILSFASKLFLAALSLCNSL